MIRTQCSEAEGEIQSPADVEGVVVLVVFPIAADIAVQSPAHQDICADGDVFGDFIVQ